MTKPSHTLGGRLPLADPATLTGAQRDLFEALKATWEPLSNKAGIQMTTADGRLIGPHNTFLLHPEVAAKFSEFQAAEATYTTLSPRAREVVIVAVGAVLGAADDVYAHPANRGTCRHQSNRQLSAALLPGEPCGARRRLNPGDRA